MSFLLNLLWLLTLTAGFAITLYVWFSSLTGEAFSRLCHFSNNLYLLTICLILLSCFI